MRRLLPSSLLALAVALPPGLCQLKDKLKDAPPKPLYAIQLAADAGKTTKLTIRGVRLDTATEVRVGEPKSAGRVVGKGRKASISGQMTADLIGDTEIDVELTLPAEAAGGLVPLSLIGPGGESKPITVLVNDDMSRVKETEPNDGFKQSMPVAVPSIVAGSFRQPQDVDVYRIDGKAGDGLRIEAQARRCGSPADPLLTLYDAAGRVVAAGEPSGEGREQLIRVTLPRDGTYFVSAIEGFDHGGPMFAYRLVVRKEK